MDRRSFFRGFAALPIIAAGAATITPALAGLGKVTRVSIEDGDPGELAYAMACGDGQSVKIFMDGVELKYCLTADSSEGWVKRLVTTPKGNLAINNARGVPLHEVVYGRVEIVLVDKIPGRDYRVYKLDDFGGEHDATGLTGQG